MKKTLTILATLLVLATAGWFWLERDTRPAPAPTRVPGPIATGEAPAPVPTFDTSASPAVPADSRTSFSANATPAESAAQPEITEPAPPAPSLTPTASDILSEPDEDHLRVAKKLAGLVRDPRAPLTERREALDHALNLSANNEAEVLTPLVTDPKVPDEFTETILSEALNRPLADQADLYLAALPVRKSAEMQKLIRDHLVFLTDSATDLGPDPAVWRPLLEAAKKKWAE
jgi:hypothetical protein